MSMSKSKSKSVEVREYMERKPVTVTAEMNIYDASQIILEHKISGVAVVDADNNLVGILSELDCMRALVTSVYNGSDPGGALVKDVMTANVEVNKPDDDIISVASSMLDHKHRRRPVVVDGKLVGQLTCRQILGAIKDFS
ncbi:MAG: CBS domain-containing protein [Bacteroidia bacterium]|jgi:CBS domain-containing protein